MRKISPVLKKALAALLLLALLVAAPLSNVSAAVHGDDYPYKGQQKGVDPWGFIKGNCTSFVAWRMNHTGKKFSNNMKGGFFNHAKYWASNAKKIGFKVNRTPKVGAIAQFTGGNYGHVAYVAEVSKDQKTIKIEEYNWVKRYGYSVRTIKVSSVSNFIHVPGGSSTTPPFPGTQYFKSGANNKYVTMLGQQLLKKGYGKYYKSRPDSKWSDEDKKAVAAFQRAQGWTGKNADGYPGAETWKRLFK